MHLFSIVTLVSIRIYRPTIQPIFPAAQLNEAIEIPSRAKNPFSNNFFDWLLEKRKYQSLMGRAANYFDLGQGRMPSKSLF